MKKIRAIKGALKQVTREISALANNRSESKFARGLASEGYAGGYRDALNDCLLLLNGVVPNRRHYWNDYQK